MAQTFELNQTSLSALKGALTLGMNTNVFSCQILSSSVNSFTAGTAVKIVDSTGGIPVVEKAAANDKIFGFITFHAKQNTYAAGEVVEVASDMCVINMETSGAILGGAVVEIVATGDTIITSGGTNTIVGRALKKAASGDVIPVLIVASRT